ncbi:hypothetical protein B296_00044373 [Ensete ventricosum]|uniref:Uncharacterized protein n=1 Tax=Ensete ventricosum TaxID=4639 RepID=A0A426Z196_ENSVE|nr:hypothetical protein B296_00044373 [Ensete ventricosum]
MVNKEGFLFSVYLEIAVEVGEADGGGIFERAHGLPPTLQRRHVPSPPRLALRLPRAYSLPLSLSLFSPSDGFGDADALCSVEAYHSLSFIRVAVTVCLSLFPVPFSSSLVGRHDDDDDDGQLLFLLFHLPHMPLNTSLYDVRIPIRIGIPIATRRNPYR